MGYDVHITRAEHWPENEGHEIAASEWHDVVNNDPDLRLARYNGPHFAIWDAHPEIDEAWLDWDAGNITTKNPDRALLRKMTEIAARLDAQVLGDDGELYDDAQIEHPNPSSILGNTSLLSLILSIVALTAIAISFALDSHIRRAYPVGTSMPVQWALALTGFGSIGVLAWLVSTVFGVAAFLLRQPSLRSAALALTINCGTCAYLVFTK